MGQPNAIERGRRTAFILDPDTRRALGFPGGEPTVELWDWFEEVNTDLRYQLTPIGAPAHGLHVSRDPAGNQFRIANGTSSLEASWPVTGVRHDRYGQAHPGGPRGGEPPEQRGHYLAPTAWAAAREEHWNGPWTQPQCVRSGIRGRR
jgi:hypothetical protein